MNENLRARVAALHRGESDPGEGPAFYDLSLPPMDPGDSFYVHAPGGPELQERWRNEGWAPGQIRIGAFYEIGPDGRQEYTGT